MACLPAESARFPKGRIPRMQSGRGSHMEPGSIWNGRIDQNYHMNLYLSKGKQFYKTQNLLKVCPSNSVFTDAMTWILQVTPANFSQVARLSATHDKALAMELRLSQLFKLSFVNFGRLSTFDACQLFAGGQADCERWQEDGDAAAPDPHPRAAHRRRHPSQGWFTYKIMYVVPSYITCRLYLWICNDSTVS